MSSTPARTGGRPYVRRPIWYVAVNELIKDHPRQDRIEAMLTYLDGLHEHYGDTPPFTTQAQARAALDYLVDC